MKQLRLFPAAAGFLFAFNAMGQNPGDAVFNSPQIHTVKLYFSQPQWWDSLIAYYPLDQKMLARMEFDGVTYDSVGAQLKGNSSFNNPSMKKSFKVDLNEYVSGQNLDGLKKFNLNNGFKDPTFLREKLTNEFCRRHGLTAPRCTYANLYLNDTLWGFYVFMEQIDQTFLETEFGDDNGNLFKGDPQGSLQWFGPAQSSYYNKYELKTNDSINDWSDLVHMLDKLNNTLPIDFYDSLESVISSSSFIKYWAVNILFSNLDSYNGSGHNYYIYHHPDIDRFIFIIWDVNEAFGCFNMGMSISQLENLSISYLPNGRPMVQKMLAEVSYFNQYKLTLCNYILEDFNNTYMDPLIDSIADVIRPHVYADTKKFFTNQQFETNQTSTVMNYPGLKNFIANRVASISSQLASLCFTGVNELTDDLDNNLYPNPATDNIYFNTGGFYSKTDIVITDFSGRTVYKIEGVAGSGSPLEISTLSWPQGIYMMWASDGNRQLTGKFTVTH